MKARVIKTGEIVDVKEWRGASSTIYTRADMNAFYEHFEIELIPDNPEKVTIEGWVARNENGSICLHNSLPERIVEEDVYYGYWGKFKGKFMKIPEDLFPSVTWETEPLKVRLTLSPIE